MPGKSTPAAATDPAENTNNGYPTSDANFWAAHTVEQLAAEQRVEPVADPTVLQGDFWPVEETTEQFLLWLKELRQDNGGNG